eukprot:COSAG02_NODE_921_length_15917_cov_4.428057_9_plen_100_part_00
MDAESIAALAMCGMVGEAALPSIKTPIGDIRINEDVDVRYNSDGGFYRARVSAIEEDAIRVTYPEDQVGTAMSRRGAALAALLAGQFHDRALRYRSFVV